MDGFGPSKQIKVDLLDFVQAKNLAAGEPKNRSLIYFKVLTQDEKDGDLEDNNQIKELATAKNYGSFE